MSSVKGIKKERAKRTVGRITKRDGESMKAIAHTGVLSKGNARQYFNLSERRIKILVKENYLTERTSYTKDGVQTYYTLGTKGRNYIDNNTKIDYVYKSNEKQLNHDLKLSQVYCQLNSDERQYWLNENQINHHWNDIAGKEKMCNISSLDGLINSPNGVVGVEIVTNNYGDTDLEQKEQAANELGCERLMIVNA